MKAFRLNLPFLVAFNVGALLLWIPVLRWAWRLCEPAGVSYTTFAVPAAVAGLLYSFLILLANKFLIQNRADALPLVVARFSFVVGVLVYAMVLVFWVRS